MRFCTPQPRCKPVGAEPADRTENPVSARLVGYLELLCCLGHGVRLLRLGCECRHLINALRCSGAQAGMAHHPTDTAARPLRAAAPRSALSPSRWHRAAAAGARCSRAAAAAWCSPPQPLARREHRPAAGTRLSPAWRAFQRRSATHPAAARSRTHAAAWARSAPSVTPRPALMEHGRLWRCAGPLLRLRRGVAWRGVARLLLQLHRARLPLVQLLLHRHI
jgi:hypothetical protein